MYLEGGIAFMPAAIRGAFKLGQLACGKLEQNLIHNYQTRRMSEKCSFRCFNSNIAHKQQHQAQTAIAHKEQHHINHKQ